MPGDSEIGVVLFETGYYEFLSCFRQWIVGSEGVFKVTSFLEYPPLI
jgi:hypothetical protein